ncbi:MAG: substrate-binding domain-containing protein [Candidatus Heimdallarchaeota archaeon]|nr:substrate-binding domain-containing protein [Candidatus Heimdallarchaeota archaeon]MDH5644506.1 substrate-binding domain-containing protein [Candidatus Heimdallarchaeota archaeon]
MSRKKIPSWFVLLLLLSIILTLEISRLYLSGEFQKDVEELEILYSSEKRGWLNSVVEDFESSWEASHPGRKISVVMTPIGSGKGTIQIANGANQPVIWSPASRFWLPILNLHWQKNHDSPIVDIHSPSIVVSPTVIATWKFYQEENNITSINDLHTLALTDPDFTFAHTDPFSSNSGFGGVIMEVATAVGKDPELLTLEDLQKNEVQQWMRELESKAVQYGSSTGFLGKMMANEGPDKLKVALLYENLIIEKNKELQAKIDTGEIPADHTLVAVYPHEGTILNDHPFAILDAPWVDNNDIQLANDFIEFLNKPEVVIKGVENGFRAVNATDEVLELVSSLFNTESGVIPSLDEVKIYSISNIDANVLERIPDLWSATRSRSLDETNQTQLAPVDYVIPVLMGIMIILIIFQPMIQRIRRYFR